MAGHQLSTLTKRVQFPYPALMTATEIRIQWMQEHGLDEAEIQQSLIDDPPISIEIEQADLDATREIKKIDLSWLPDRIREIKVKNGVSPDAKCAVCLQCEEIIQSDEEGNWWCSHLDERKK